MFQTKFDLKKENGLAINLKVIEDQHITTKKITTETDVSKLC